MRGMEDKSLLLKTMGRSPKLRIIDFLLDNAMFDFSKKEIIEETGMSKKTFYKYWDDIENSGIVKETRKFGKAQLYQIDKQNPVVKKLIELEEALIDQSAEKEKVPA